MKHLPATIATLLATWIALPAFAAPEATVLFAQPGTQIISPTGVSRPVKKGDVVQTGERLVTPPGGISQIKLLDGSLVGLRPDSELKIALPPAAADKGVQVVSLTKGAVHVVGAELMDDKKPSRFTLQSGLATLQLKGADLESSIVPATGPKPQGSGDAGSYNRMLVGDGTIGFGGKVAPLESGKTIFSGNDTKVPPVVVLANSTDKPSIPTDKQTRQLPKSADIPGGPLTNTLGDSTGKRYPTSSNVGTSPGSATNSSSRFSNTISNANSRTLSGSLGLTNSSRRSP